MPVPAAARTKKQTHTQGQVQTMSVFETCDSILHSDYSSVMGTSPASTKETESSGGRVVDALPCSIVNLFVNLSEQQFRLDLSSTELRNRAAASARNTV